ncbi:MAG: hypothetical protein HS126_40400 [Anaerolineales bacterium]|nr:hypothetical protein [Anaerolineales bacterium]
MRQSKTITIELDEREAMLLFGMIHQTAAGLPRGLRSYHDWSGLLVRLANGLLGLYRS